MEKSQIFFCENSNVCGGGEGVVGEEKKEPLNHLKNVQLQSENLDWLFFNFPPLS